MLSTKLANTLAQGAGVQPTLSASERWTILPKTFEDEDYHIGWYMIGVSKLLGLNVYLCDYEGAIRSEFTAETEKISEGLIISLEDFDRDIRVRVGKKDSVELGRTLVRAQQTIRLFSSPNLGMEALQRNHFFFGNNPGETEQIDKMEVKVKYSAKTLDVLFKEEKWAERLRQLLLTLIRESARLLSDKSVNHAISTNLLTRDQTILTYCATTATVVTGKGRKKKEEKVKEIPKKPKPSPLLSQNENQFIDGLAKNIFKEPPQLELTDWAGTVSTFGYPVLRDRLKKEYAERRTFREAYARITTSRLKDFRKLKPELRYKKKKDITGVDLDMLLGSRNAREAIFANEVSFLDPHFSKALAYYREEVKRGDRVLVDTTASRLRIQEDLVQLKIYSGIVDKKLAPKGVQIHAESIKPMELPKSHQGIKISERPEPQQSWAKPSIEDISQWDPDYDPNADNTQERGESSSTSPPVPNKGKQPSVQTEAEAQKSEVKNSPPGSIGIDNQLKIDMLKKEHANLDGISLEGSLPIWLDDKAFVTGSEKHFSTEPTYKNIVSYCKRKCPVLYATLPDSQLEWYKARDIKAPISALSNAGLEKLSTGKELQARMLVKECLRKLVTGENSFYDRAIALYNK